MEGGGISFSVLKMNSSLKNTQMLCRYKQDGSPSILIISAHTVKKIEFSGECYALLIVHDS